LAEVKAEWEPPVAGNYRAQFVAQEADVSLQAMLTGIGVLSKSELAGERMFTAYDNQDQEDEHSCFSDNTHRDIVNNAQGIANVINGRYQRIDGSVVSGTSLLAVVTAVNPELAAQLSELAVASMAGVNAIPAPFDQAIINSEQRPVVLEAVYGLQDQGDKLAEVAAALGIVLNTSLPE
jgi:putative iron-regulated protein